MHMRAHVFGDLLDIKGLLPCSLRRVSQVNPEFAHLEALMTYFPQGLPSSLPSKVGATGIQQSFGRLHGFRKLSLWSAYLYFNLPGYLLNPESILFRASSYFSARKKVKIVAFLQQCSIEAAFAK